MTTVFNTDGEVIACLEAGRSDFMVLYKTNAPEAYDYATTMSLKVQYEDRFGRARLVAIPYADRYQVDRYLSGMYFCELV